MLQNVEHSIEAREVAVKEYEAETRRIQVMQTAITPQQMQDIAMGTVDAAMQTGDVSGQFPEPTQQPQQQQMPTQEGVQ